MNHPAFALRALCALHAKGMDVPGEISVVGYDDLPESRFFEPPWTTIHHDFAWEGERCVEVLFRAIKKESVESALYIQHPALVIRESTGGARVRRAAFSTKGTNGLMV